MLRRLKILLFLQIIFSTLLYSQTIGSINISGNKNFKQNDYLEWINISPGQSLFSGIKDTVKKRISFNLNQRGFFHYKISKVSIDTTEEGKNNVDVNINIKEGEPTYLKNIFVQNVSKIGRAHV